MEKPTKEGAITRKAGTAPRQGPKKKPAKKKTAGRQTSERVTETHVGIKKQYLRRRNVCKVTFRLPRIAATDARSVSIVGDFNDWNIYASPMRRSKNGDYTITFELESGREYQFRYLIDESKWENDWNADKYVKSPFGDSENSVVIVQ